MQKINKNHNSSAAKALSQWKKKHPTQTYNDLGKTEKGRALRRDVREALIAEQYCLCAYCTMRMMLDDSHNEHVIPKGGGCAEPNKQLGSNQYNTHSNPTIFRVTLLNSMPIRKMVCCPLSYFFAYCLSLICCKALPSACSPSMTLNSKIYTCC